MVNYFIRESIYTSFAQNHISPANYYKDINRHQKYLLSCHYLLDINNERAVKNQGYKERFSSIDALMLLIFTEDSVLNPRETSLFGDIDQNSTVQDMRNTQLYKKDYIGLKTLDQSGKVHMLSLSGDHLNFDNADIDNTFIPFLKGFTSR